MVRKDKATVAVDVAAVVSRTRRRKESCIRFLKGKTNLTKNPLLHRISVDINSIEIKKCDE